MPEFKTKLTKAEAGRLGGLKSTNQSEAGKVGGKIGGKISRGGGRPRLYATASDRTKAWRERRKSRPLEPEAIDQNRDLE